MCNLETEGTQHACGHYVITRKVRKIDCNSPFCVHSASHKTPCYQCDHHEKFLGPDVKETVTKIDPSFCVECAQWYKNGR